MPRSNSTASRRRPQVTVLLGDAHLPDTTKPSGGFAEEDLETQSRLREALEGLKRYDLRWLENHDRLLAELSAHRPAFVLNFCDTGYRNVPTRELHVAALLDLLEIPYSGSPPAALASCYDKSLVTSLARGLGIPAPWERYFETPEAAMAALPRLPMPALIKPNQGDGSLGITARAVVRTRAEARAYLDWMTETLPHRDVLVQEYLPGPEYGVALIGNPATGLEALPMLEADFSALPPGSTPICCYESKAVPDSPYWSGISYREARLGPATRERLVTDAGRLFGRLGLRDYGRVDFRADSRGTIRLLEVNPNPAWAYDGKLALMAGLGGRSYAELLQAIIETALHRVASTTSQAA